MLFRDIINWTFNDSKPLSWPPAPTDIEIKSIDELLPPDFLKFLNFLICGDAKMEKSEKTERIALYIGQVRLNKQVTDIGFTS